MEENKIEVNKIEINKIEINKMEINKMEENKMEENKIKHLEFIQNIISRMNSNSFQIKNWMITIVAAMLALYANSDNVTYIFAAIIPTLLFWYLDSFYLQQEKKFRKLYNDILSDKSQINLFSMPIDNYKVCFFCDCFFTKTTGWLYGTIIALLVIGGVLILKYNDWIIMLCKCIKE